MMPALTEVVLERCGVFTHRRGMTLYRVWSMMVGLRFAGTSCSKAQHASEGPLK